MRYAWLALLSPHALAAPEPWQMDAVPQPQVLGALTVAQVAAGLSVVNPAIARCYAALLAQQPGADPLLIATFEVAPGGASATRPTVGTTKGPAWLTDCVAGGIAMARYPTASAPTQVRWELYLDPHRSMQPGPFVLDDGDVSWADLDAVVRRHMDSIQVCYRRELQQTPGLAGKVVIKAVVDRFGNVSAVTVKSTTLHNSRVENCLVGRFMRMVFPEPPSGDILIFTYPLMFLPE